MQILLSPLFIIILPMHLLPFSSLQWRSEYQCIGDQADLHEPDLGPSPSQRLEWRTHKLQHQ